MYNKIFKFLKDTLFAIMQVKNIYSKLFFIFIKVIKISFKLIKEIFFDFFKKFFSKEFFIFIKIIKDFLKSIKDFFFNIIQDILIKEIFILLATIKEIYIKIKKIYINIKIIIFFFKENKFFLIYIIFLIIFFFLFIDFIYFDFNSFFISNIVIPENPEHNKIVLPNEVFEAHALSKNKTMILPMRAEYPVDIIISETFNPHQVKTIKYEKVLDFFYNEMKNNEDFFETDLSIIELYVLVSTSDHNYFYYYYYYYLFCDKLLKSIDIYAFALIFKYDYVPTAIWVLRDKFLVMRKRKILFYVLKQGLDLILMVRREKEKEYEEKKKQAYQKYQEKNREENKEKEKREQEFKEFQEERARESAKNQTSEDKKRGKEAYERYVKRKKKERWADFSRRSQKHNLFKQKDFEEKDD